MAATTSDRILAAFGSRLLCVRPYSRIQVSLDAIGHRRYRGDLHLEGRRRRPLDHLH
jgi:hypothetical protein